MNKLVVSKWENQAVISEKCLFDETNPGKNSLLLNASEADEFLDDIKAARKACWEAEKIPTKRKSDSDKYKITLPPNMACVRLSLTNLPKSKKPKRTDIAAVHVFLAIEDVDRLIEKIEEIKKELS